jgi:hypothetical protein
MANAKKIYNRYPIVRRSKRMRRGGLAEPGSLFREFVITSHEYPPSTLGTFQVYGLQGGAGVLKDGKLVPSDEEPAVLFGKDFDDLDSATKQFDQLIAEAQQGGFAEMDILEFRHSRQNS